jgi:hypothetical protein
MPRKAALLIGVSEYGEGIPPLSAPTNDVEAMKRVLENPNMGGFDEVQTLINAESVPIQQAIQRLFKNASKEDLILLFFSGHGITDDENNLFLATCITPKDNFEATAVSASFIQRVSRNSYAKRQIIILDCCYSGAFATGWHTKSVGLDLKKELGAEGRVVLTSSTATQTSFQQEGAELSLYTQYLVEGIETGAADSDADGKIHVRELHDYAKAKVQEVKPKMQPEIILDREGFNILLSQAPVNDPELEFRQLVGKYANHGEISEYRREIFKLEQKKRSISDEKAEEIINSVLEPFRRRIANLARYKEEFRKQVARQYPLEKRIEDDLRDWQEFVLGLNDEDVASIQQWILSELEEKLRQEEADRQRQQAQLKQQPTPPLKDQTDDLSSKVVVTHGVAPTQSPIDSAISQVEMVPVGLRSEIIQPSNSSANQQIPGSPAHPTNSIWNNRWGISAIGTCVALIIAGFGSWVLVNSVTPKPSSTKPVTSPSSSANSINLGILKDYEISIYFPKNKADLDKQANDIKKLFITPDFKGSVTLYPKDTDFFKRYNYPYSQPAANEIRYTDINTDAAKYLKEILKKRYPSKQFHVLPIGSEEGKYVSIFLGP